ncbi:MAG TPA: transcriptional regulator NrdR [Patescibacteria group bacterium]|nr:transcriptional regulator NrdR [Patescibacteria group bacterium]
MFCPFCGHTDTKVIDSRLTEDGGAIRRRRECEKCGERFSTYEEMVLLNISVVKRDGRKEAYEREKTEQGIKRALEKRPISHEEFRNLINRIERDIQVLRKEEIKSSEIGGIVMKELKTLDEVAYIRFASVYKSFKDVKSFERELKKL